MGVLSYTNAFPGIPAPQHFAGQSSVQNFIYPGAVQPKSTKPLVLSYTNAFPGIPAPQHFAGQSSVQDFTFPGALQPAQSSPPPPITGGPTPKMFIPIPTWEY